MSRKMEKRIVIAADPERVWKTLTDPEELTRWFPIEARVEPGEGGSILYSWGPGLQSPNRIEIWEPMRHLRLSERLPGGVTLALDFHLEAERGGTTLRLVHAGFRDGEDWSDEYDAFSRGWDYELRSLRHYLERQFGRDRALVLSRRVLSIGMDEAWRRLTGHEGIVTGGFPTQLHEGVPLDVTLRTGERIAGSVLIWDPMRQFAAVAENMGGALVRLELMRCGGPAEVCLWMASYGAPGQPDQDSALRWTGMLREILGDESA